MKDLRSNLPRIETITDEVEYAKCFAECAKSCSKFAEDFLGLDVFPYNKAFLDCDERFCIYRTGRQCLEQSEYVYTNEGIKQCKELKSGDEILSGKVEELHEFEDDLYEIRFWNGIKIKCNPIHPFYTRNSWITAEKLTTNDYIEFKNSDIKSTNSIGLNKARLFGYLYSDGYFAEKQSVKFVNNNQEFHRQVRELTLSEFGLNSRMTENNTRQLLITHHGSTKNPIIDYIKKSGLMGHSLGVITSLPHKEMKEFINGYFNGDGYLWVGKRPDRKGSRIELGFSVGISELRAYELQYMLWKLGVDSIVKKEWHKKSTRPFYRVLICRKEALDKILTWIDRIKYPDKFTKAEEELKKITFSRYGNFIIYDKDKKWVKIKSIKKIGKGKVIGFSVTPSEEIISYCGMRTHNTGKTRSISIKAIWFGYFAPLLASNIGDGACNIVIASITKDQAYLIFRYIRNFIHKSPTLRAKIVNETKTELSMEWFDGGGITNFIVRPIGDTGDSLRGYSVHMAILDEAAYIPQVVYDAFIASTVTTKPRILLTSTPKGKNGPFFNFCEHSYIIYEKGIPRPTLDPSGNPRKKSKNYNWVQFHVTTFDSPLAANDPEVLDVIKSVSKASEKQELYGEFLDSGNSVISYNLMQEALTQVQRPKFEYFELGVDTSGKGSDETVLMTFGVTSDCIFPIDVYTEVTTDQVLLAKKINELNDIYHYRRIYIDSTGLGQGLVDNCKHENPSLPVYSINFREFKTDLYVNLERLFEHRLINLSLLEQHYRDKLDEQLRSMYFEYGKHKESPERVRTDSPHDDWADACALGCYGQTIGEEIQELDADQLFNDNYVDWSD